ncbi:RNA-binding protein [Candidatus Pacearchaeota archaeon]|nr:RNA-binding protein [Candidatus Pacearchaeota archaeon]|tara:strand:- start:143 stop:958 length:816 start_codon:yes stop_codon:yes gene_type:complete
MSSMEVTNLTREKLRKMFAEGKRFDGRKLDEFRDLKIEFDVSNQAEGSARVRLGKTEVVVGIKLGFGEPYPDSPDKGNLMVSADLLPLASPRFEHGPPGFNAIELPRLVDRAIRASDVINLSDLVIEEGKKVWTVFVDLYPINDDGNLIDAASFGAIAALKKAVLPLLDKDGKIDHKTKSTNPVPLAKDIAPISFSFFKLGDSLILDPTREEQEASEARITFGISTFEGKPMVNSCQKYGEDLFSQEEIEKAMSLLPVKFEEINKKLKSVL